MLCCTQNETTSETLLEVKMKWKKNLNKRLKMLNANHYSSSIHEHTHSNAVFLFRGEIISNVHPLCATSAWINFMAFMVIFMVVFFMAGGNPIRSIFKKQTAGSHNAGEEREIKYETIQTAQCLFTTHAEIQMLLFLKNVFWLKAWFSVSMQQQIWNILLIALEKYVHLKITNGLMYFWMALPWIWHWPFRWWSDPAACVSPHQTEPPSAWGWSGRRFSSAQSWTF